MKLTDICFILVLMWGPQMKHKFTISSSAEKVDIAGTFSNWERIDMIRVKNSDDQANALFVKEIHLGPGRVQYKFVTGDEWFCDESSPKEFDGSNWNNVIEISDEPADDQADSFSCLKSCSII